MTRLTLEEIDDFLTPNIPQASAIWRLHSSTAALSKALRRRRVGDLWEEILLTTSRTRFISLWNSLSERELWNNTRMRLSTHFFKPSITEFIESESANVVIDPCSTRVTMKEPAFRANSTRASSAAYIFFGSIVLVFYIRDVCSTTQLTLTTSDIFSTTPTRLWRPGTGARPTICWISLRAVIVPWSTVCGLLWPVESAGDGGGGTHSVGDDVKGPEVAARIVSRGFILGHGIVFELTSGAGRWQGVGETGDCLAIDGPSRPIENLLGSSTTSMERWLTRITEASKDTWGDRIPPPLHIGDPQSRHRFRFVLFDCNSVRWVLILPQLSFDLS